MTRLDACKPSLLESHMALRQLGQRWPRLQRLARQGHFAMGRILRMQSSAHCLVHLGALSKLFVQSRCFYCCLLVLLLLPLRCLSLSLSLFLYLLFSQQLCALRSSPRACAVDVAESERLEYAAHEEMSEIEQSWRMRWRRSRHVSPSLVMVMAFEISSAGFLGPISGNHIYQHQKHPAL